MQANKQIVRIGLQTEVLPHFFSYTSHRNVLYMFIWCIYRNCISSIFLYHATDWLASKFTSNM